MKTAAVLVAVLSAASAVLAAPANTTEKRATLATVYSSCSKPKTVALTFDDGPYYYMYDISKAIVAAGGKATFAVNGNNYGCIYDTDNQARIKYLYGKGHQIINHSWSHPDLTTLTFDQIHDQMWKVEQALERIIGAAPAFMRPPFGNYNDLVRQVSAQRGQNLALWDLDTEDSLGASVATSEGIYTAAVNKNPSNILALNHETVVSTAEQVVPFAIQLLQSKGYQLVTLADCLGLPAYQWTTTPGTPDSSWTC